MSLGLTVDDFDYPRKFFGVEAEMTVLLAAVVVPDGMLHMAKVQRDMTKIH